MTKTRDEHLFGPGPKRILALDGGGVRGLIALGVLSKVEALLAARSGRGDAFRLSDYFDLIAGTSTGSIIATGLALGWKVAEVKTLYDTMAPTLFPPTNVLGVLKFRRDAAALEKVLHQAIGDRTLASDDFKTGYMVCAKRMDTDSAWVLTNNPRAKFWESTDGSYLPNRDYSLKMLIRASAAAPTYFEPAIIDINDGAKGFPPQRGAFVDGAISGHNSPALSAYLVATLPAYGFGWRTGAENLLLVSVGTGDLRTKRDIDAFLAMKPAQQALEALKGLIADTVRNDLLVLQALSEPARPWTLNSEVGDLQGQLAAPAPLFAFQRYDVRMVEPDVIKRLGLETQGAAKRKGVFERMTKLDDATASNLSNLYALGVGVGGEAQDGDFPRAFDI